MESLVSSANPVASAADSKESKRDTFSASSVKLPDLLAAANRFQVSGLLDLCAALFNATVSVNLGEGLLLAQLFSQIPALMRSCLDFIREDPARLTNVMTTPEFQQLDKPSLHALLANVLPSRRKTARS